VRGSEWSGSSVGGGRSWVTTRVTGTVLTAT
jgi:hypothetical protein